MADDLISLVLYGSVARGEDIERSDYDFYVVARGLPDGPINRSIFLREILFGLQLNRRFSIRGKGPKEMREILPLFLDLAIDGIILYDRDDFMKSFLEKVLKEIDEHKLTRYRTGEGYYGWQFEKPVEVGENIVVSLED